MDGSMLAGRLATKLKLAARWRNTLAQSFPAEKRYAAAADRLQRLAADLGTVDPHIGAIFLQVHLMQDDKDRLTRVEDDVIAAIGFSFAPRTATELVRALCWKAEFGAGRGSSEAHRGRSCAP